MPLKGVLLQKILYEDPLDRSLTDVDVLVEPGKFDQALKVLKRAGYRQQPSRWSVAVPLSTPFQIGLDLHRRLFDRYRYRFDEGEVFKRSVEDRKLYAAPVEIASWLDLYAYAIGKFASDHLNAYANLALDEIALLGDHIPELPAEIANALHTLGLTRAAHYTLPFVIERTESQHAQQVLEALPRGVIDRAVLGLVVPVLENAPARSRSASVCAHLLNDTLVRASLSGVRALPRHLTRR